MNKILVICLIGILTGCGTLKGTLNGALSDINSVRMALDKPVNSDESQRFIATEKKVEKIDLPKFFLTPGLSVDEAVRNADSAYKSGQYDAFDTLIAVYFVKSEKDTFAAFERFKILPFAASIFDTDFSVKTKRKIDEMMCNPDLHEKMQMIAPLSKKEKKSFVKTCGFEPFHRK